MLDALFVLYLYTKRSENVSGQGIGKIYSLFSMLRVPASQNLHLRPLTRIGFFFPENGHKGRLLLAFVPVLWTFIRGGAQSKDSRKIENGS